MREKPSYVYIMTNKEFGVLYIGHTDNLRKRVFQHKQKLFEGFTKKYNLTRLVYFETHYDLSFTRLRETRMKKWKREWKIDLISEKNPEWRDLSLDL